MTKAKALCNWLRTQEGKPYLWGGKHPDVGFDCSGLVQYGYHLQHIIVPAGSYNQFNPDFYWPHNAMRLIPISEASKNPGCLVFKRRFKYFGPIYHVGIVLENGQMIEAKGKKWGVIIHSFIPSQWFNKAAKIDALYKRA